MSKPVLWRARVSGVVLLVMMTTIVAHGVRRVEAAPLFQMPFPCGESWQGETYDNYDYGSGKTGHVGPVGEYRALDLNRPSDEGDIVVASARGRVLFNDWSGGYGWLVKLAHGGGWETWYAHLQERPSLGSEVNAGDPVGKVGGSGGYPPHLHYEQRLNGALQHIHFDGAPIAYWINNEDGRAHWAPDATSQAMTGPGPALFTSNNCGATRIEYPGDGSLVREQSSAGVYVMAGGAKFGFGSEQDFLAAGYRWEQVQVVPDGTLTNVGNVPVRRTLVRNNGEPGVYVVAGGAKFGFGSEQDFLAAGYSWEQVVVLPTAGHSHLGNIPANGTVVRNNGEPGVYVVAGGAKFGFGSEQDFLAAGYSWEQVVVLPTAGHSHLGNIPANGTVVREHDDNETWLITDGKRSPTGQGEGVVVLPADALAGIPIAGASPPPEPAPSDSLSVLFDGDPATSERVVARDSTAAAIEVSRARFSVASARHVLLSRDDAFPDSLAAAGLAADGPLLYTSTSSLPKATREEVARALPQGGTVYLLGGEAAIGSSVAEELRDAGYRVERLAGPSRVETAIVVADRVRELNPAVSVVALARASAPSDNPTAAWADSVTGGAWAASVGVPVLVTGGDALHPGVRAWLERDQPEETVLLGGSGALSEEVARAVPNPRRVAGGSRHDTAAAVSRQLWDIDEASAQRRFVIIDGYRSDGWAFGLAAAGAAADAGAPLLMVHADQVPEATLALVGFCGAPAVDLLLAGDEGIISGERQSDLDYADGQRC